MDYNGLKWGLILNRESLGCPSLGPGTLLEPSWNPAGTLLEPGTFLEPCYFWNIVRTLREPKL